jgi:hypothetical protein
VSRAVRITARFVSAAALAVGLARPVGAQIPILVVDAEGRPVPAVRVDVFGAGESIAVVSTTSEGIAELSAERWSEVRRISLSHLGFQTLIVQAADIPADGVIRLEPEATEIEGLTVEGRELCPIVDDPRARRLWAEAASLYAADTGSRSWLAYLSRYGGAVREDELHRTSDAEAVSYVAAGAGGVIHGGDHTPRSLEDRVSAEGYAWPPLVIGGTSGGRSLAWSYPELDRAHAYHFASPVFGEIHDFALASESEGHAALTFCAKSDARGATVSGTLSLVPGRALVAAEWRFHTVDPDEGAGGSVSFRPYFETPGARPHLVASRGLFYRYSGTEPPYPHLGRTYAREVTTTVRWHLNPSAERPCNTGLSYYLDPPVSPQGVRFTECVEAHWGRQDGL